MTVTHKDLRKLFKEWMKMQQSTRFDYVKYDEKAAAYQAEFKAAFIALEAQVEQLAPGRAKALILTKIEEAYMWVGKAIRDDQVASRGAVLQEDRDPKADAVPVDADGVPKAVA